LIAKALARASFMLSRLFRTARLPTRARAVGVLDLLEKCDEGGIDALDGGLDGRLVGLAGVFHLLAGIDHGRIRPRFAKGLAELGPLTWLELLPHLGAGSALAAIALLRRIGSPR